MSTTTTTSSSSLGLPEKPHWKTSIHHHHGRHDSGELDVFEAAGYYNSAASPTERKVLRGGEKKQPPQNWRWERRFSLDVPLRAPPPIPQNKTPQIPKQDKKPHPASPAGRLASFLNSLFNQAASNKDKKKKKKKSSSKSLKDSTEDESPSTLYSSSISGFRTPPPPYSNSSPNKSYYSNTEDLRTQSSQRLQIKSRVQLNPSADSQTHHTQHKTNGGISWLHEKLKLGGTSNNGVLAKPQEKSLCNGSSDKVWNKSEEEEFSKFRALGNNDDDDDDEDNDGVDSDSSSDLFELENYELGFYSSSGLPVYETTRMESIGRARTVSSVPL